LWAAGGRGWLCWCCPARSMRCGAASYVGGWAQRPRPVWGFGMVDGWTWSYRIGRVFGGCVAGREIGMGVGRSVVLWVRSSLRWVGSPGALVAGGFGMVDGWTWSYRIGRVFGGWAPGQEIDACVGAPRPRILDIAAMCGWVTRVRVASRHGVDQHPDTWVSGRAATDVDVVPYVPGWELTAGLRVNVKAGQSGSRRSWSPGR
jgi:hypothetical protein